MARDGGRGWGVYRSCGGWAINRPKRRWAADDFGTFRKKKKNLKSGASEHFAVKRVSSFPTRFLDPVSFFFERIFEGKCAALGSLIAEGATKGRNVSH